MIIYRDLIVLIIAFTCVGVFVATAIASMLNLFNLLKLATDIRKKLHAVLIVEIVGIAVAAFAGFLNPKPIVEKVKDQKTRLEKQITDSTKEIFARDAVYAQKPHQAEVELGFPWVDTAFAPRGTVTATSYLQGVGISITEMTPQGSEVVFMNNRVLYGGRAANPTTSENLLTQINTNNVPASFTIKFSEPLAAVRFVRPALLAATESGITHPAWSAHALDTTGRELSSQSETLTRSFSDVPARTYTLVAPGFHGISGIRFASDPRLNGKPFAAFSAVLIEKLTMIR